MRIYSLFALGTAAMLYAAAPNGLFGQTSDVQYLRGVSFGLRPTSLAEKLQIVGPGMVRTFAFTGVKAEMLSIRATETPWPTEVAGISVQFWNGQSDTSEQLLSLAIKSISQSNWCGFNRGEPPLRNPACLVTNITGQVPFGVSTTGNLAPPWRIRLVENGLPSPYFSLITDIEVVHVLNRCDTDTNSTGTCLPWLVSHEDGPEVSIYAPARPGETLVMQMYGLGFAERGARAGEPAPPADPEQSAAPHPAYKMLFDWTANSSPNEFAYDFPVEPITRNRSVSPPASVKRSEKEVGVYEVRFVVPDPPPGAADCPPLPPNTFQRPYPPVSSNLNVMFIGRRPTSDGASICVAIGDSATAR